MWFHGTLYWQNICSQINYVLDQFTRNTNTKKNLMMVLLHKEMRTWSLYIHRKSMLHLNITEIISPCSAASIKLLLLLPDYWMVFPTPLWKFFCSFVLFCFSLSCYTIKWFLSHFQKVEGSPVLQIILLAKASVIHSSTQPWVNPTKTSGKGLWNPQLNPALRKHEFWFNSV